MRAKTSSDDWACHIKEYERPNLTVFEYSFANSPISCSVMVSLPSSICVYRFL